MLCKILFYYTGYQNFYHFTCETIVCQPAPTKTASLDGSTLSKPSELIILWVLLASQMCHHTFRSFRNIFHYAQTHRCINIASMDSCQTCQILDLVLKVLLNLKLYCFILVHKENVSLEWWWKPFLYFSGFCTLAYFFFVLEKWHSWSRHYMNWDIRTATLGNFALESTGSIACVQGNRFLLNSCFLGSLSVVVVCLMAFLSADLLHFDLQRMLASGSWIWWRTVLLCSRYAFFNKKS